MGRRGRPRAGNGSVGRLGLFFHAFAAADKIPRARKRGASVFRLFFRTSFFLIISRPAFLGAIIRDFPAIIRDIALFKAVLGAGLTEIKLVRGIAAVSNGRPARRICRISAHHIFALKFVAIRLA
jgi:hypothetical protein